MSNIMISKNNKLFIGDPHLPYECEEALDFILHVKKEFKVSDDNTYCTGDLVDLHTFSRFTKNPDLPSPGKEVDKAIDSIKKWRSKLPKMKIAAGNHERRIAKICELSGIPKKCFKSLEDILELKKGWEYKEFYQITKDTVLIHGMCSGVDSAIKNAKATGMNTVSGHAHSSGSVIYMNTKFKQMWGMSCSSLVDRNSLAMSYSSENINKALLGVGVLLNNKIPLYLNMEDFYK